MHPDWFPIQTREGPRNKEDTREKDARAICARCPVKLDCRDFAIVNGIKDGIFGNMDAKQRRSEVRKRRLIVQAESRIIRP